MTTQFPDRVPDTSTVLAPTATRVTPAPARPFSSIFQASASAVVDGAEAAAHRLPGGPLVSAAIRPGPHDPGSASALGSATHAAPADGVLPTSSGSDPMAVIQAQADQSLYFLQLQQQIQEENRTYSTVSNVLKARHETVKNAIGNLR